jgi:hypothetical protein
LLRAGRRAKLAQISQGGARMRGGDLGQRLANTRAWAGWRAGSELKGERDKTATARRP